MNAEPIITMNFILCVAIFLLALYIFSKKKLAMPLIVGIAFALFAISHLAVLLGLEVAWETFLIALRTVAYLLVLFALLRIALSPNSRR
jgi:hypothetical protein